MPTSGARSARAGTGAAPEFVQGVLRGLRLQQALHHQCKLVRRRLGEVFDEAVDLRPWLPDPEPGGRGAVQDSQLLDPRLRTFPGLERPAIGTDWPLPELSDPHQPLLAPKDAASVPGLGALKAAWDLFASTTCEGWFRRRAWPRSAWQVPPPLPDPASRLPSPLPGPNGQAVP
jgi:hypothetical protein